MAIGTRESSFLLSFLLLTAASTVVVSAAFGCPDDEQPLLDYCNRTVECPVYQKPVMFSPRPSLMTANCSIVLTSRTVVMFIVKIAANLTLSAACMPGLAVGQPTSSTAATLLSSCSSARYQAQCFFFPGDVVLTFAVKPPLPDLLYQEVQLLPLCTAVISLNSSLYVVPPLDFAGGGNCTSRLESPPGTAMKISLIDSHPRIGGGLISDCVCYSAEGVAASGCLAADSADVSRSVSPYVGRVVTLTVKGDSAGLLCSAVLDISVNDTISTESFSSPEHSTSIGEASRLYCSCRLLLVLLLL